MELPPRIELHSHPMADADIIALLTQVTLSPFIGELTRDEVEAYVQAGNIRFLYEGETLLGFGAWKLLTDNWLELGPIFLLDSARGRRLGRVLFEQIVYLPDISGHKMWAVTKNPIIMHLFSQTGFRSVGTLRLPWAIKRHMLSRLNLRRVLRLITKFRPGESVRHYIQDEINPSSTGRD